VLEADVPAPFVSGALLPVIVLPYRLAQQLSATQLAHVLRHEMWHVRQHDVWINWLLALVRVGFWFHPLPRLLGRRLREAREECCDDAVLAGDPAAAGGYARTLLRVAEIAAGGAPPPSLAFAMADHEFAAIQARIRRVLRRDPTQRAPGPLRRLGLLLGCLAFAAAATWLCPTVRAVPAPAATGAALTPSPAGHAATHAARHAIRHRH
jgi:beta-lactamase regulating signal transducer with metallopeptidase domain